MNLNEFKLAAIAVYEFTDRQIERAFLEFLEITNENDIREVIRTLSIHRPELIERLKVKYCASKKPLK